MNNLPSRPSIQDLELNDSEEVQLYVELIRIIERDIDEIKAGDTKSGWTSWAIIGGIAGALLLLFGETRKLQTFPTEEVKLIGLAGLLLYQIAIISHRAFNLTLPVARPGRIKWTKEANFPYVPTWVYKLLIFLVSFVVTYTLTLPTWVKTIALATWGLWALLTITILVFSFRKQPIGNNKVSKKSGFVMFIVLLIFSVLSLLLLGNRIHFPIGEAATLPYILAGLIVATVLLIENLISTLAPSRLLTNLQDLRDDIIFLRVEIDEALQRYQVLTEGETLPDALKEDLSEVLSYVDVIEYAHSNMNTLLEKMIKELPVTTDSEEVVKQKQQQLRLDKDSYSLHNARCSDISGSFKAKLLQLNKRISELRAVSEDWVSENNIRSFLVQRIQAIDTMQTHLNKNFQAIDYYIQNPDKIPSLSPDATRPVSQKRRRRRRRRQRNDQDVNKQT
jgi:SHS2 domain-containing protein